MKNIGITYDRQVFKELMSPSDLKAVLLISRQLCLYFICLIGAIADYSLLGNLIAAVGTGFAISQLMIIGHDACHQALAKSSLLNKIIGRVGFIFGLHSYSAWDLLHNKLHHRYTNIKGIDPVWSPLTKSEYDNLNWFRQTLEKIYRHPLGSGVYYIVEMWLGRLFIVNRETFQNKKFLLDAFVLMASLICQISLILWIGVAFAPQKSALELMILGWLIPFLSWNQIMGFVVYLHHTHPQVPWLLPDDSVRFFDRSILVTPHFHFPFEQDLALGIISGHTAHHCYSRVPFPNLKAAQEILIERSEVIQEDFSIAKYLETTAICKLYDFDRNCWTDFNGIPTSIIHNLSNYKL